MYKPTSPKAPAAAVLALAAFLMGMASTGLPAQADDHGLTVVELFTSQGCSSCPPADAFLGDLAERKDVIALSVHVDYWDYMGWKDDFARPDHTSRQRDYSKRFDLRYVYTPQMVIQGAFHATGSDRSDVEKKIQMSQAMDRVAMKVSVTPGDKPGTRDIQLSLPARPGIGTVNIVMAMFDAKKQRDIKRGENKGKQLTYTNVVRKLKPLDTWTGAAQTFTATFDETWGDDCAILLQDAETGHIIGAARLNG